MVPQPKTVLTLAHILHVVSTSVDLYQGPQGRAAAQIITNRPGFFVISLPGHIQSCHRKCQNVEPAGNLTKPVTAVRPLPPTSQTPSCRGGPIPKSARELRNEVHCRISLPRDPKTGPSCDEHAIHKRPAHTHAHRLPHAPSRNVKPRRRISKPTPDGRPFDEQNNCNGPRISKPTWDFFKFRD